MKKLINAAILLSVTANAAFAADMQSRDNPSPQPYSYREEVTPDPGFVLLDIILYRPAGLAITAVGTAVFVGMSPLTAMASIAPPHDAFDKTYKVLIRAPMRYTFVRPVGDRSLSPYRAFYEEKPVALRNVSGSASLAAGAPAASTSASPLPKRAPASGGTYGSYR
ncbi:MAG: hypothetical protein ACU837_08695 [Gammaproteobacteria bacterium]